MESIDNIYKYIARINIKNIRKQCRDIIESMKTRNNRIKDENEALIKGKRGYKNNKRKNNKDSDDNKYDDEYEEFEQKEQSPLASKMYIVPPNEDYD